MEQPNPIKPCGCDIRDGKLEVCRPKMLTKLYAKVKELMTDDEICRTHQTIERDAYSPRGRQDRQFAVIRDTKGLRGLEFEIHFPFWASGNLIFKGETLYLKLHVGGTGPDSFHWEMTPDGNVTRSQSFFTDDFGDGDAVWEPCPFPPEIYVQEIMKCLQPETPAPTVQKLPQKQPAQTQSLPQSWRTRLAARIREALSRAV